MKQSIQKNRGLLVAVLCFGLLASLADVGVAVLLQTAIDIVTAGDFAGFWRHCLVSGVYLAVLGAVFFAHAALSKRFICRVSAVYRARAYAGIQRRNPQDFAGAPTADYLSALTNDSRLVEDDYLQPLLDVMQYGAMFVATLVLLLLYSPAITGALVLCMAAMFIAPSLIGRSLQALQDRYSGRLSAFTGKLKDLLGAHEVLRAFRLGPRAQEEFSAENNALAGAKYAADRTVALSGTVSTVLSALTQFVVIFLSGYFVMKGSFTVGTLMGLTVLSGNFVVPILKLMEGYPRMKGMRPVIEKLDTFADYEDTAFPGREKPVFQKAIEARGLSFGYGGGADVLRGLCAVFRKGGKYAVVGASGCGKTTLIRLLTASYAGYGGAITVDGADLRDLDSAGYGALFSVIHQQVFLFDRTVRMNIGLWGDHPQAAWDEALGRSGVAKFLPDLPQGLDTPVGENGCNLSGGQRQRVAVARALLHGAPVLILDEGTSAVDMQTAYDIERELLGVGGLTLITITHNMSEELLRIYDEVLYMKDGAVAARGALPELLEGSREFAGFYTLQT